MDKQKRLRELLAVSERIVFFGGAGVSTESGIPDFRSDRGVFNAVKAFGYPPEELLSSNFFAVHPDIFYSYYKSLLVCPDARPNPAHEALARLEAEGKLTAVVTQNIDGLHQMAGSRNVLELHGSMRRNHCTVCKAPYPLSKVMAQDGVPQCGCGGIIRPDVVLYGEMLDESVMEAAIRHIRAADLLIVGGTSLVVHPAAGLVRYFGGHHLVLINKGETAYDISAHLVIREAIGKVLGAAIFS